MIDADNMSGEVEQTDEAEQATPEQIQHAKDMGWVAPKDWRGAEPKNGFLSPQEYVRRGEKIMPIVRAENRKLLEKLDTIERERAEEKQEHRQTIARIERMSSLALDQQREQIEERYASRKEAAVEVGDKGAYQQAVKDEKEATKALDDRLKEAAPEAKTNGKATSELPKAIQDTIDAWKVDNGWYSDDPTDEMTAYANARHARLLKEKKGLTLKENLEQVTADTRKRFPEQFGAANDAADDDAADDDEKLAPRGSRVEGGSRLNGGGARSLWSTVPADAKKVAAQHLDYFLKSGETLEKNVSQARERWAEKYFEGESK